MTDLEEDARRMKRRPIKAVAAAALDGELLFKCQMVDFSAAGARLRVNGERAPDRFQLIDIAAGMAYSVRVVWRRAPAIGVAFLHTRSMDDPAAPEWLANLWRELLAADGRLDRPAA